MEESKAAQAEVRPIQECAPKDHEKKEAGKRLLDQAKTLPTCVPEELPKGQQRAVDHLHTAWETSQAPLRLLKQAIVPLNAVPRFPLFH